MSPSLPAPVDRILDYTAVAANALHDVATASQIPFLTRDCTITLTIIAMVQNTRFQRERCLRIVNEIHHSLCALTSLAIHSDHIQAPKMLDQIAQYASTLQKFDSCLRSQRELGTIKRLFKQGEITAQLDTCETELRLWKAKQGVGLATAVVELNIDMEMRHQEVLELISSRSSSFETMSLIGRSSLNASSGSFSLFPACPKIFHGRESELEKLIDILMADPARIAILGPGGMGKTTLAMAALHHPKVALKYQTRHFISCESAHTRNSLVAIIGSHLGLDTSSTSERAVLALLSAGQPCLMILDNFETPWEALEGRAKVEAFLALLADIPHVALLAWKVQWTHPFLRPLMPLDRAAARQTFFEIADEIHDGSEVDQLLDITDNIPLAVQLVAGIAASVGCRDTMERWNLERTALLSAGYDKRSNLDISITLSLSSPRMLSAPHTVELISLMSLLPDGISDLDLVQSNIPIQDIPNCKTTLIRTSLAYVDHAGRFKVLAPIRDHIHLARPPSLQLGLDSDHTDVRESVLGTIMLNSLNITMNRGLTPLMQRLPGVLSRMDDPELHGRFIICTLSAWQFYSIPNPEMAIEKAIEHFRAIKDADREATYYLGRAGDYKKAEHYFQLALSVALQNNSHAAKFRPLGGLSAMALNRGNYSKGLQLAKEIYRIGRTLGNVWGELDGVRLQALCYLSMGNFKQSLELLDEGKELIFRVGVQGGQMETLLMNIEANLYLLKSEYSDARRIQEAILHKTSVLLSPVEHAYALVNIASIDIAIGAPTDVVSHNLNVAMTTFRNGQHSCGISACDYYHADLQHREGNATGAAVVYIRIFAAARDSDDQLACLCLRKLADPTKPVHADTESARWAVVFLAFALRPQVRSALTVHQALQRLGDTLVGQGAEVTALSILAVALDGFTQMDVHQSRAECMCTMGNVYMQQGDIFRAQELWEAAQPLFEHAEQEKEVTKIDERLQMLDVAQKFEALPKAELPAPQIPLQESDVEGEKQKTCLIPDL
ncbi:hypothetical protein B0H14DRAFT_3567790 [Mycena olivaceomarginata]|nr:hypothetical protein B0H14DRAFT_3567790 [Mycena olivaceomarginata]